MSSPDRAVALGRYPTSQRGALSSGDPSRIRRWVTRPFILWALLWLAINTGPWNLADFGAGLSGTITAMRAAFPLVVTIVAFISLARGRSRPRHRSWAELGFWFYGVVMLLACTGASGWFDQAYWGFAFLATLAIVEHGLRAQDPLQFVSSLNWLSWVITSAALATMLFMARDVLYAPGGDSAYGLIVRFQNAHGYLISRETGLSRMAAVPAIIALAFLLSGKAWQKALSGAIFAAACYVVWIMQSRGALFAFVGAFAFVLLFGHRTRKGLAIIILVALTALVILSVVPASAWRELWLHASREHGLGGLSVMSGRPEIWQDVIDHWVASPLIGYGPQGDRVFGVNAQNALLYALISAGSIGALFFLLAMGSSWKALISLTAAVNRLPERERLMFQITGAILVFATLRSIPENNAALFSVDLLLQYPAMIYLTVLSAKVRQARREAARQPVHLRSA